jgi:cytidine deaminase
MPSAQETAAPTSYFHHVMLNSKLLMRCLVSARQLARPAISSFKVGAVALGKTGALYSGANIEVKGGGPGFCVHAEQTAIINALAGREPGLTAIAVTAVPCGHCRQFIYETAGEDVEILVPGRPTTKISVLLPSPFGASDLGIQANAFSAPRLNLSFLRATRSSLAQAALDAATRSFTPVTNAPSGVALKTAQGKVYQGSHIEVAAVNPSMPPLMSALAQMVVAGDHLANIRSAALAEINGAAITQRSFTADMLRAIAPKAALSYYVLESR